MNHCASIKILIVAATIFLSALVMGAKKPSHEGDEWLQWNSETQKAYIQGYIRGIQEGFTSGCHFGLLAGRPAISYEESTRASNECWSQFPISDKDSFAFINQITLFYKQFPDERGTRITDVLKALHKGESLGDLHKSHHTAPHNN